MRSTSLSAATIAYGNLLVPASARRAVDAAFAYLSGDAVERSLIDRLEHGTQTYRLALDAHGDDSYDPLAHVIHWDPHSALETTEGGRQSPALGLGHEIDHAVEDPRKEMRLANRADLFYDTAEERRVIRGSESHAARTLGEDVRYDHGGSLYHVASPIARQPSSP